MTTATAPIANTNQAQGLTVLRAYARYRRVLAAMRARRQQQATAAAEAFAACPQAQWVAPVAGGWVARTADGLVLLGR